MDLDQAISIFRFDQLACLDAFYKHPNLLTDINNDNRTLLHLASGFGFTTVVETLIKMGADLEATDNYGETPIFRAIQFRHDDCLKLLLQSDLNSRNTKGRTPLHLACKAGTAFAVKTLLDNGSDPTAQDFDGLTPIEVGEASKFSKNQIGIWKEYYLNILKEPRAIKTAKALEISPVKFRNIGGRSNNDGDDVSEEIIHDITLRKRSAKINIEHTFSPKRTTNEDGVLHKRAKLNIEPKSSPIIVVQISTIECEDGHLVKTPAAKIIDDWLYNNDILHRLLPKYEV